RPSPTQCSRAPGAARRWAFSFDKGVRMSDSSSIVQARGFGIVTGGGPQMSPDGSSVQWVGIDLELTDLGDALAFTRERLRELGAPAGSVLEYRAGEQKMTVQIT